MKKKFDKKGYNKKRTQKLSRKKQLVELKKQPKKTEEMLEDFFELFDPELISFYEFDPEKETFNEACEKIRIKERNKNMNNP